MSKCRWVRPLSICAFLFSLAGALQAQSHFLTEPDIHFDQITFGCEGDIWMGSINSGRAVRLTSDEGEESHPHFSPDGKWIAFTGEYDGTPQVYVMSTEGGSPKRLTYFKRPAIALGWTSDGKSVLFRSQEQVPSIGYQTYRVPMAGGLSHLLPIPTSAQISVDKNGVLYAYTKFPETQNNWKRYHGGQANKIWIFDSQKLNFKRIDDLDINEQFPVWAGEKLIYVSEVNGSANLWVDDVSNGTRRQLTFHSGLDVKFPSTDGDKVVYQFGSDLWAFDLQTGQDKKLTFKIPTDQIHTRSYFAPLKPEEVSLGPTGKRLIIGDRGQYFSVPAIEGESHPVATQLGTRSSSASWSPNGQLIAFVSDRNGEENIWIEDLKAKTTLQYTSFKEVPLMNGGGQPTPIKWSSDSKSLLFSDFSEKLWKLELNTKKLDLVCQSHWGDFQGFDISPDLKTVAYCMPLGPNSTGLFLFDSETSKTVQIEGSPFSDASPIFDNSGKYLFFLSKRDLKPRNDDFDFNTDFISSTLPMVVTLQSSTPSPFLKKSDEEPVKPDEKLEEKDEVESSPTKLKVDYEGISSRVTPFPVPSGDISAVSPIEDGVLIQDGSTLSSYNYEEQKIDAIASDVEGFTVSEDEKQIAVVSGGKIIVGPADQSLDTAKGVDLSSIKIRIDPPLEWKEDIRIAWRHQRDVFYDPLHHGMDMDEILARYLALVPSIGSRGELNTILGEMIGEMNVSHEFAYGGQDNRLAKSSNTIGSLGIDLALDPKNSKYQIKRILKFDGFDFSAKSPLEGPGIEATAGNYLLAIDGHTLSSNIDPNSYLLDKGGKRVVLKISKDGTQKEARNFEVTALTSDVQLRYFDWVSRNRDYVTSKSAGKYGYIHLPDMETAGATEVAKWLYANAQKEGLIIDVRNNLGGDISPQILEKLQRIIFEFDQGRYGNPTPNPSTGILGHVVALCNEGTSSDGEYFCQGFRYEHIGPVIGMRTWGGFMAVGSFPLLDGIVSTPIMGSFSPDGKWLPDGTGFTPDEIVDQNPNDLANGKDSQLDAAISALDRINKDRPVVYPEHLDPPSKYKAFPPNNK